MRPPREGGGGQRKGCRAGVRPHPRVLLSITRSRVWRLVIQQQELANDQPRFLQRAQITLLSLNQYICKWIKCHPVQLCAVTGVMLLLLGERNKSKLQNKYIQRNSIFIKATSRLPGGASGKETACRCGRRRRRRLNPWVGKIPWRTVWQPPPGFWPGESQGQRTWWARVHGVTKSRARLK